MESNTRRKPSCTDCGVTRCREQSTDYPPFCHCLEISQEEKSEIARLYSSDSIDGKMALAAAQIEGRHYCRLTRAEETIKFIKMTGVKKVGIATCNGLLDEARCFAKMLQKNGIDYVSVICKVGGVDKREMGLAEEDKINPCQNETMCNPVLQARVLNRAKTELNISIGLCVGHDALFNRHSEAPVTTLIAKDRVLCHNPAGVFYTKYYQKLYK